MTTNGSDAATLAAMEVMKALQPLSAEEKARVLRSAAALHEIPWGRSSAAGSPDRVDPTGKAARAEEEPAQDQEDEPGTREKNQGKRLSIVEFLGNKAAATNPQRIAVFASYHERVVGKDKFSRDDLEKYFAAAKLAKPQNYVRDFSKAVAEGWIHEDGADSYLTQAGERAVDAGFGGKGKARGRAVAEKPRKGKKGSTE